MAETNYFLSGLNIVPAGPSQGNAVTSSASANTYGSWAEFIASASEDTYIIGFTHYKSYVSGILYGQISVGIGSVGSEVEKAVVTTRSGGGTYPDISKTTNLNTPLRIPSGSRVVVRVADNLASALTHYIHLNVLAVSNVVNPVLTEVTNPTGLVVADGSNSVTSFKTDLSGANDYWNDTYIKFTSGSLINQVKKVTDFDGTSKFVTTNAFTAIPDAGAIFEIINQ